MDISIIEEVAEQLNVISQVLEFVRALAQVEIQGTPGQQLLHFAGSIPDDDLLLMHKAIAQDCEQVDANEW